MGSKGSQTTTTSNTPDPQAYSQYLSLLGRAGNVASQPYTPYGGELVAPFNSQQNMGVAGINSNASLASAYLPGAIGQATTSSAPLSAAAIQQYMSPYTQQVVNATQAQFNNQNAQQMQGVKGNAIAQNALGGNREGIAEAELANQQQLAQNPVIAGLYNSGYNQAVNTAEQQQAIGLQGAGLIGNLGVASQTAGLQGAGAQLAAGTQEQQTQQAQDTAAYQQFQQQQAFPYQQTQWLAGIDSGIGSLMGGSGQTTAPAPNMWNSILGGVSSGVGALGATGAFGSAGWLAPLIGLSDRRVKENIQHIGATHNGQKLYMFNFKGDPQKHIGLIAQEVEKKKPEAVHEDAQGLKHVDYGKALERARGGVAAFAEGGGVAPMPWAGAPSWIPNDPITHGRGAPSPPGAHEDTQNLQQQAQGLSSIAKTLMGNGNTNGTPGVATDGSINGAVGPTSVGGAPLVGYARGGGVAGYDTGGAPSIDGTDNSDDVAGAIAENPDNIPDAKPAQGVAPAVDYNSPDYNPNYISPDLTGRVQNYEGYKSHAYPDGSQYSIGYGSRANSPDETIDRAGADQRLHGELSKAQGAVDRILPADAPDSVRDALTSFTYNLGPGWTNGSLLATAVQRGDYAQAAQLMQAYNHSNGAVNGGLTDRRLSEGQWMMGNAGPVPHALAFSGEPDGNTNSSLPTEISRGYSDHPKGVAPSSSSPPPSSGPNINFGADSKLWPALMSAGFGMMSSRSPFLGVAIGEGGQAGVASYNAQQAQDLKQQQLQLEREKIERPYSQVTADQAANIKFEQQKLDIQTKQMNRQLAQQEFNMTKPITLQTMTGPRTASYDGKKWIYSDGSPVIPDEVLEVSQDGKSASFRPKNGAAPQTPPPAASGVAPPPPTPPATAVPSTPPAASGVAPPPPAPPAPTPAGPISPDAFTAAANKQIAGSNIPSSAYTGKPGATPPAATPPAPAPQQQTAAPEEPARPFKNIPPQKLGEATIQKAQEMGLHGQAMLDALPLTIRNDIEAAANYEALPGQIFSKMARSGMPMAEAYNLIRQVNPKYNEMWANANAGLYKSFIDGGDSKQIVAYNTAITHAGEALHALDLMKKIDPQAASTAVGVVNNWLKEGAAAGIPFASYAAGKLGNRFVQGTPFGAALAEYQQAANGYAAESAKVYAGANGGTGEDREIMRAPLDSAKSMPEVEAALATSGRMMGARSDALQEKWHTGTMNAPGMKEYGTTGKVDDFPTITEKNKPIIADMERRMKSAESGMGGGDKPTAPVRKRQNGYIFEQQPDGTFKNMGKE